MSRARWTEQGEILAAVVRRIRDELERYNEANCYVVDQPIPPDCSIGRELCTVSPGDGTFPQQMQAGAGSRTVTEDGTFEVTALVRHVRDRPSRSTQKIMSQADGLLQRKWELMRCLLADDHDLVGIDNVPLLREQLSIVRAGAPGEVQIGEYKMIGLSLTFGCVFDWALPPIGFDESEYLE